MTELQLITLAGLAFVLLYLLHRMTRSVLDQYQVDPDDRFGPMLCYPNGPLADDTKELIERSQDGRSETPSGQQYDDLATALNTALPILETEADERENSSVDEPIEPVHKAITTLRAALDNLESAPGRDQAELVAVLTDGVVAALDEQARTASERAKLVAALELALPVLEQEAEQREASGLDEYIEPARAAANAVRLALDGLGAKTDTSAERVASATLYPVPADADKALVLEMGAAEKPEWNLESAVWDLYHDVASQIVNGGSEYQIAALRQGSYSEARIRALFANRAA